MYYYITNNEEFKVLCLKQAVSPLFEASCFETRGDHLEEKITNRFIIMNNYFKKFTDAYNLYKSSFLSFRTFSVFYVLSKQRL